MLAELVDAVQEELRAGRPPAAIVRGLCSLGIDRPSAKRMVDTIRGSGRSPRPPVARPRGLAGALIIAASLVVLWAGLEARNPGFPIIVALAALAVGVAEIRRSIRRGSVRRPAGA